MSLRTFTGAQPSFLRADQVRPGNWIVDRQNARFDRRVIEAGPGKIDQLAIRIHHDYGNGGEPATSFYAPSDGMWVLESAPQ